MILFLCTPDVLTRERRGLAKALEAQTSVEYLDRLRGSASQIMDSLDGPCPSLVLYPDSPYTYLPHHLEQLNVPTACLQIDAYAASENRASLSRLFDLGLIFHPDHLAPYRETGHPGILSFPHAIPADPYAYLPEVARYDVATVGRLDGLDYAYRRAAVSRLGAMSVTTNDMERYHPYPEMIATYARSRVSVNVSRGAHLHEAHLSCLEIMGAGTLLLTTRDPEVNRPHELEALGYREGEHFATFATLDELQRKIEHYLQHDEKRSAMAARARELTLRKHTYDQRAETLLTWIESGIPLQAPARTMPAANVASLYVDYFSKRGRIDETLAHLRRQRRAGGSQARLLRSIGQAAKATVRGWQNALFSSPSRNM
jgi:hypothetical protein